MCLWCRAKLRREFDKGTNCLFLCVVFLCCKFHNVCTVTVTQCTVADLPQESYLEDRVQSHS